jgi:hypothetical protein
MKHARFRPRLHLLESREVPAQIVFAVNEALSSVELSGSFDLAGNVVPFQPQGAGSLTTAVDGTIVADLNETDGTIQFLSSTNLTLANSGSWQPGVGGAGGTAAANFGATASAIGITLFGAVRGGAVTMMSGALPLFGTNPRTFDSTQLTGMFTAGSADYAASPAILPSGSAGLTGSSASNEAGSASSLNLTGTTLTLTIPVTLSYTVPLSFGSSATLNVNGSLQATAIVEPDPEAPYFVVGIGGKAPAGVSQVQVFNADGTPRLAGFDPYSRAKATGVRVVVGDVTGDGVADIVTGPGPGVAARVKTFDGVDGSAVGGSFLPYGAAFVGGIGVAVGDVVADTDSPGNEIVVSAAGRPVKVYDETGKLLTKFSPFGAGYLGAVRLAVGDVVGGGLDEIVVTRGAPVQLRTFGITDLKAGQVMPKFSPVGVKGNPYIAVGRLTDSVSESIILGDASGGQVHVFNNNGSEQLSLVLTLTDPYGASFAGGVRVGVFDADGDGLEDILTAPGKTGGQLAKLFLGSDGTWMTDFDVFNTYNGGFFVAGT